MTIQNADVILYSGNSVTLHVTTKSHEGSRIDLRESEIFWALAKTVSDETLVLKESAGPGINLTDAENGEFEIDLTPADSESLLGTFYHEAEVNDLDGNETTIFTGQVTIKETAI